MQNETESTPTFTPKTPDFKHRYDDCPANDIGCATGQINTVLRLLYDILQPKTTLPPAHVCTVERLHSDSESLKQQVMDALFIIDSLNSDIAAIAQTID
jgi:hypothetical protein